MKQNCKQTFIHKNNYYLATSKNVGKGGKFGSTGEFIAKGSTRGKYDGGGGGGAGTRLSLDYNLKKSDKKKGRKFENSKNSKNNRVLNSNYCCCKYSTFSIKKSKYCRVLNSNYCIEI